MKDVKPKKASFMKSNVKNDRGGLFFTEGMGKSVIVEI